jgi:ElaB/YqjD/DUF883 family membrane-anchored ribosome-binding protein
MATAPQSGRSKTSASDEKDLAELQAQIEKLQTDVAALGASLTGIGTKKLNQAKGEAENAYQGAISAGQHAAEEVRNRAMHYEADLETSIRENPLVAVASAAGIGFLIALLMKR